MELSLVFRTTALGDDWKKYIAGLKMECIKWRYYEVTNDPTGQQALQTAFLNGTVVTLKLYVDSTNYYTGEAYINSLSIEDPVDDVVNISIEFTGNGTLTFETGSN